MVGFPIDLSPLLTSCSPTTARRRWSAGQSFVAVWLPTVLAACVAAGGSEHDDPAASGIDRGDRTGIAFERVRDIPPVTDRASTGGVSWIDHDGDGDLDLFVTNGYDVTAPEAVPQANRLYENLGGGRFRTVESGPLVADSGFSSGSAWADLDNDGDPDAFVTNQRGQANFLYRNDGDGRFTRISPTEGAPDDGGASFSASWADVDRDGRVDLLVANGGLAARERNFLYRNRGGFRLERVEAGPVTEDSAGSAGISWRDFDADGRPDLFVANRYALDPAGPGMSRVYRNLGDWRFAAVSGVPGSDSLNALSGAWDDFEGDGRPDLYVANASGANRLYRNDGRGGFERVSAGAPVLDGGSSYAAAWGDLDNDGDLDLVVGDWGSAPRLYENPGDGSLRRVQAGDLGRTVSHVGSLALADYDGDGALDLYIGNWPNWPGAAEENELYRNRSRAGNWLVVRLEGRESNRSGIGARVAVRARLNGRQVNQVRELGTQPSWRSQSGLRLHFGLGDAERADEVTVHWPSGAVQTLFDIPANQGITVVEGEG